MHLKLADFVASGHTVELGGETYGVPVGGSEVMLEFIAIELALGKAPEEMVARVNELEESGKADDPDAVMEAIKDQAAILDRTNERLRQLALGLLRKANPDVPDLALTPMASADIIRLSLGRAEEIEARLTGQQIAANTLGIEQGDPGDETDPEDVDADPPTRGQSATAVKSRSRSATRSRKHSSR